MDEAQILERMRARVRRFEGPEPDQESPPPRPMSPQVDVARLEATVAAVWSAKERVAQLNPRNRGMVNDAVQAVKKAMKRSLGWYTRSLQEFNSQAAYALQEQASAIRSLDASLRSVEQQLTRLRSAPADTSRPQPQRCAEAKGYGKQHRRAYVELFRGASEVVDLSCGAGEFLEMLRDNGISGYGVSPVRNVASRDGVKIVVADPLEHVKDLAERSLGGVFTAGYIEHLRPEMQAEFLHLLAGKLRPGAVAVIETVSADAGDASGTLAPDLLEDMLEVSGFRDIRVFTLAAVECERMGQSATANNGSRHVGVPQTESPCGPTGIYSVAAYRS